MKKKINKNLENHTKELRQLSNEVNDLRHELRFVLNNPPKYAIGTRIKNMSIVGLYVFCSEYYYNIISDDGYTNRLTEKELSSL